MFKHRNVLGVGIISFTVALGALLGHAPAAHAALAGEDGPIIYIDNSSQPTDPSTVNATTADGSGDTTVATDTNDISSATISAGTPDNSHSVVYGDLTPTCEPEVILTSPILNDAPVAIDPVPCTLSNAVGSDAVLNQVTIDANNQATSDPKQLATLTSLYSDYELTAFNAATNLSFSPDSSTVLVTQGALQLGENEAPFFLFALKTVDTTTGAENTLVDPSQDLAINGGYAQNGNIYFTQTISAYDQGGFGSFYDKSNLFVLTPGSTIPVQITDDEDGVSEYFIDVSPDSGKILVADINSCSYEFYSIFDFLLPNDISDPTGGCDYYLVDAETGKLSPLVFSGDTATFVPKFFAPDGSGLIGQLFDPVTAFVPFSNTTSFTLISQNSNVQSWAPKGVPVVTTAVVGGKGAAVAAPQLTNTGSPVLASFLALGLAVGAGAVMAVPSRRSVK
jgi:hypothetical protein